MGEGEVNAYLEENANATTTAYPEDYSNHSYGYGNETNVIHNPGVQAIFYLVYAAIFVLGIFGNVLVCFVVGRNKAMQTVTNFFITNLGKIEAIVVGQS